MDLHHTQGEVDISLSCFVLQNWREALDRLLDVYADLSFQGTVFPLVPPLLSHIYLNPMFTLVPIFLFCNILLHVMCWKLFTHVYKLRHNKWPVDILRNNLGTMKYIPFLGSNKLIFSFKVVKSSCLLARTTIFLMIMSFPSFSAGLSRVLNRF